MELQTWIIWWYSLFDIQDYFNWATSIWEKAVTDNPLTRIYLNKIGNLNTFEIKSGYYLELLTPENN